jgi:thioredoxin reductase (NADPH)
MSDNIKNIVIIGSGPAGHSAAIYSARANLHPLMFEGFMAGGVAAGGQLTTTTEIENYAGFPGGISGPELMIRMRQQAIECGTEIVTETVSSVDLSVKPFTVKSDRTEVKANSIIIATGAIAKRMHVPLEDTYWQKGISAWAVCDGALPIFRNNPLAVIGGGDTACEEALHLAKFGSKIYLLHRRDELRASKAMQKRVFENDKIEILWDTILLDVTGNDTLLTGIKTQNVKTHKEHILEVSGLFYAIGHTPNTSFLDNQIELNDQGYIITKPGTSKTVIEGVFAAGDVQDHVYRQAITSAGTGCMAALDAENYLGENGLLS